GHRSGSRRDRAVAAVLAVGRAARVRAAVGRVFAFRGSHDGRLSEFGRSGEAVGTAAGNWVNGDRINRFASALLRRGQKLGNVQLVAGEVVVEQIDPPALLHSPQ